MITFEYKERITLQNNIVIPFEYYESDIGWLVTKQYEYTYIGKEILELLKEHSQEGSEFITHVIQKRGL